MQIKLRVLMNQSQAVLGQPAIRQIQIRQIQVRQIRQIRQVRQILQLFLIMNQILLSSLLQTS